MGDESVFVSQDYRESLSEIKRTTKPTILKSLAMVAYDYIAYSNIIVDVIEECAYKAHPSCKVVYLTLIDRILKDYEKYIGPFSRKIVHIFVNAYLAVDEKDKSYFIKLLDNWRSHKYFPSKHFGDIEAEINRSRPKEPTGAVVGMKRVLAEVENPYSKAMNTESLPSSIEKNVINDETIEAEAVVRKPVDPRLRYLNAPPPESEAGNRPHKNQKTENTNVALKKSRMAHIPDVNLTYDQLQKRHKNPASCLYELIPVQCGVCGTRFMDDAEGKAEYALHLDSHYRRNRRMKDKLVKAISREWFMTTSQWIAKTLPAVVEDFDAEEQEEEKISVPCGNILVIDTTADLNCAICFGKVDIEWSEDKDDWIYKGAAMYLGKVCHCDCIEEVLKTK